MSHATSAGCASAGGGNEVGEITKHGSQHKGFRVVNARVHIVFAVLGSTEAPCPSGGEPNPTRGETVENNASDVERTRAHTEK